MASAAAVAGADSILHRLALLLKYNAGSDEILLNKLRMGNHNENNPNVYFMRAGGFVRRAVPCG
jgi:hypothetical protein